MTTEHTPADTPQDMAAEHAAEDAALTEARRLFPRRDGAPQYTRHAIFVAGAAWQRAQIAARRDEVENALERAIKTARATEKAGAWTERDRLTALGALDGLNANILTAAVLAALGVSDR